MSYISSNWIYVWGEVTNATLQVVKRIRVASTYFQLEKNKIPLGATVHVCVLLFFMVSSLLIATTKN